jgi:hypothetical protein
MFGAVLRLGRVDGHAAHGIVRCRRRLRNMLVMTG